MSVKGCLICKNTFEATTDNFYKNKSSSDGLSPYCKECEKKRNSEWQRNNKDKIREVWRRDNLKRRNVINELNERLRVEGYNKKWQQENKDRVKQYNEKRQNKNHDITAKEWTECKDFFNNSCAYCGISNKEAKKLYKNYLHKEHVDPEGSNKIDNCIPACKICNSSKHTLNLDEWYNPDNTNFTKQRYKRIKKWLKLKSQ